MGLEEYIVTVVAPKYVYLLSENKLKITSEIPEVWETFKFEMFFVYIISKLQKMDRLCQNKLL